MNAPFLHTRIPALTDRTPADDPRPRRWSRRARGSDVACLAVLLAMAMPMTACVAPADPETPPADTETPPVDTENPPVDTENPPADTDTPPVDTDDLPVDTDDPPADTEDAPIPGCDDSPVADAAFAVELGDWPAALEGMFPITAPCTVTAVEEVDAEVVTTLECDDAGELRPVTLRIAASHDGSPSWSSGAAVVLEYYLMEDNELGTGRYHTVSLRRADDQALLVAAVDGDTLSSSKWLGGYPGTYLEPLAITEDQGYCGWENEDDPTRMAVGFALDGESLDLVSGQRGILPIPGETDWLAVDLAEATVGHCCHYSTWFRLLVRRVA